MSIIFNISTAVYSNMLCRHVKGRKATCAINHDYSNELKVQGFELKLPTFTLLAWTQSQLFP